VPSPFALSFADQVLFLFAKVQVPLIVVTSAPLPATLASAAKAVETANPDTRHAPPRSKDARQYATVFLFIRLFRIFICQSFLFSDKIVHQSPVFKKLEKSRTSGNGYLLLEIVFQGRDSSPNCPFF
jgi:hypothetical protein